MNNKTVMLIIGVCVLVGISILVYVKFSKQSNPYQTQITQNVQTEPALSDEDIKMKLRCDRQTAEVLSTDVYCDDLELYRRDLALTDDEIKKKFACDRLTRERRQTDVYCQNPQKFRDDLQNGQLIEG